MPTKLTTIFSAYCYLLSYKVGTFDILAGWICNYPRDGDDLSPVVRLCCSPPSVWRRVRLWSIPCSLASIQQRCNGNSTSLPWSEGQRWVYLESPIVAIDWATMHLRYCLGDACCYSLSNDASLPLLRHWYPWFVSLEDSILLSDFSEETTWFLPRHTIEDEGFFNWMSFFQLNEQKYLHFHLKEVPILSDRPWWLWPSIDRPS